MKKITNKTFLKQGNKTYRPVESDILIYWVADEDAGSKIVAQSISLFQDTPVINLDKYVEKLALSQYKEPLNKDDEKRASIVGNRGIFGFRKFFKAFKKGWKSNPNEYTQEDLEKTFLAGMAHANSKYYPNKEQFIESLSHISIIEVDDNFQILNYK
jgi:hypothetical protein